MTLSAKRLSDLSVLIVMTPLWLPLLILLMALAFLFQGRPVLFKQTRMGRHCRPFAIWKIRTMHEGASAPADALFNGWTYSGDARVTRFGRILRRSRLDELPQLYNVIRGDMSLVGPRPEPWEIAVALGEKIPGYHERHAVLPGLTGPCQLSPDYCRFGTIELSAVKLEHDLRYVRERSFWGDICIFLATVPLLVTRKGMT